MQNYLGSLNFVDLRPSIMFNLRRTITALVTACLADPLLAQNLTVQIGFLYPLNYPFVLANLNAAAQIIDDLPPAVAYGLNIGQSSSL